MPWVAVGRGGRVEVGSSRGRVVKGKNVGASGQFHNDWIGRAFGFIVFCQPGTQAAGLHTDNGIQLRIEVGGTTKDLRCNLIFLQRFPGEIQRMAGQILKEFAKRVRSMEFLTGYQRVNLPNIVVPLVHWSLCVTSCDSNVTNYRGRYNKRI